MVTFKDAKCHVAIFPEEIPEFFIKAGCPENGIVLDPFMGGGTTAEAALKLKRKYIGFEINPEYIKMTQERLKKAFPNKTINEFL